MSDLLKRFVVHYYYDAGVAYGYEVVEIEGRFRTEEVSAGSHSFEVTEFITGMWRPYLPHEVFEDYFAAEAHGLQIMVSKYRELKRLVKRMEDSNALLASSGE